MSKRERERGERGARDKRGPERRGERGEQPRFDKQIEFAFRVAICRPRGPDHRGGRERREDAGTQHVVLCSGGAGGPEHSTMCCFLAAGAGQNTAQCAVFRSTAGREFSLDRKHNCMTQSIYLYTCRSPLFSSAPCRAKSNQAPSSGPVFRFSFFGADHENDDMASESVSGAAFRFVLFLFSSWGPSGGVLGPSLAGKRPNINDNLNICVSLSECHPVMRAWLSLRKGTYKLGFLILGFWAGRESLICGAAGAAQTPKISDFWCSTPPACEAAEPRVKQSLRPSAWQCCAMPCGDGDGAMAPSCPFAVECASCGVFPIVGTGFLDARVVDPTAWCQRCFDVQALGTPSSGPSFLEAFFEDIQFEPDGTLFAGLRGLRRRDRRRRRTCKHAVSRVSEVNFAAGCAASDAVHATAPRPDALSAQGGLAALEAGHAAASRVPPPEVLSDDFMSGCEVARKEAQEQEEIGRAHV